MVLANIDGKPLTDPAFASIWKAIDERNLPVLVHPSAPPGVAEMAMHEFQLTAPIGFTFDTSLAIGRCIFDGFLDRYPNLKLIAAHGGGALPPSRWCRAGGCRAAPPRDGSGARPRGRHGR